MRAVATKGPFHFILFVTARCNARCRMCFYLDEIEMANANLSRELTLDEIDQVFRKLDFVPYISLSGGEPFLREDIEKILHLAALYCDPLMISVPTNCSMPERVANVFETLCGNHPKVQFEAQISIDGVGDVHDEVRRVPGLFDQVLETMERLDGLKQNSSNLRIKIVTTYSAFNQDGIAELIDYADEHLSFDRLILAWAHGNCDPASLDGLELTSYQEMLQRVDLVNSKRAADPGKIMTMARLVKTAKEVTREEWNRDRSLGQYCNAGRKIIVLSEQGELYPCELLSYSLGNVRNSGYDLRRMMAAEYGAFIEEHPPNQCHCDWGCGQNVAIATHPKFWRNGFKKP